jgi:hypothetical protein
MGELRAENSPYDVYHKDYLYPDSTYVFHGTDYKIEMSDNSIYEPIRKILSFKNEKLTFGNPNELVHHAVQISLKIPDRFKKFEKQLILFQEESKNYFNGKSENAWFTSSARTFGSFSLDIDTIAPNLKPKFKILSTPQAIKRLAWTVGDDKSRLAYYALFMNGRYHLLEYESKNNELFADISKLETGSYECRVLARDGVGNEREILYTIVLK